MLLTYNPRFPHRNLGVVRIHLVLNQHRTTSRNDLLGKVNMNPAVTGVD